MTRTDRTISSVGGGAPDWDTNKAQAITSGDSAPSDGFVVISGGGIPTLSVNGIQVSRGGNNNNNIDHSDIIPVTKNDIITYSVGNDWSGKKSVKFYPTK